MHKLWIVARREYGVRVRKKSFIITTLTISLMVALLPVGVVFLSADMKKDRVVIVDESGHFRQPWPPTGGTTYTISSHDAETTLRLIRDEESEYTAMLYIPGIDLDRPDGIVLYTKRVAGFQLRMTVQTELTRQMTARRLALRGIDEADIDRAQKAPAIRTQMIGDTQGAMEHKIVAFVCAFLIGLIMYVALIIYGVLVMNGVVEEKSNRIVEVIVSAVRPLDMMLGKIIGVAAVGLTQLTIWVVLGIVLFQIVSPWLGSAVPLESAETVELKSEEMELISNFMANMASIDFTMLGLGFVIYFVGGYFFYASLFAAAASAANDASDLNSLSFPITLPLIVSSIILNAAIQDPDGALAFWFSMIPLTSPVVMIGRIPFGVPWWEFILSIVLLIGGFVATAWVAARIYRVGILLYGKKHSLIELLRWIRTAG
jgi:ABC-2 type transport system permease protein